MRYASLCVVERDLADPNERLDSTELLESIWMTGQHLGQHQGSIGNLTELPRAESVDPTENPKYVSHSARSDAIDNALTALCQKFRVVLIRNAVRIGDDPARLLVFRACLKSRILGAVRHRCGIEDH